MKRLTTLIAASLLATATAVAPALAQGNSGNAPGNSGGGMGASANAPGQMKQDGDNATQYAPGLLKPDKANRIDTGTTAAVAAKSNFGTLISSIRAGKGSLDGVMADSTVNVVQVEDLIQGSNRVALDNALAENEAEVEALRDDLAALDPDGLADEEIDRAVAARTEADGSLTVYLD